MIKIPKAERLAILAELTVTGGALFGCLLRLFQNDMAPDEDTVLSDFTEATFTGYTSPTAPVAWHTPGYDQTGKPVSRGDGKVFETGATPSVTNIIYGYYVVNADADVYLFGERFAVPRPMSMPLTLLEVQPQFALDPAANAAAIVL